jgi:acetyl esterase/lipase
MWAARIVLVVVLAVSALLSLTPPGRATIRATMVLISVLGAANATSTANRPDVRHTSQTLLAAGGTAYLDIFAPQSAPPPIPGAREAIILISGVGDNRQIPQLVNLADSFAESGVVVMTLTTDALLSYALNAGDEDAVVQAFQVLAHYPGVNPRAIGLVGLSAGSGLICLAAADPRIRDQVAFVTTFGGYYDTTDLLRDIGRQALTVNGQSEPWQPQIVPVQVLAHSVAPLLPGSEGDTLKAAFDNGFVPITPDTLQTLSPVTVALYHLLAGDEPGQVEANLALLTPAIQQLLTALSPASVVSQIRAKVFLMHDRHDAYVPFTESQDFAAALQQDHHSYEFVEFDIFAHVEVKGDLPLGTLLHDGSRLFGMLDEMVSYGG